MLSGCLPDIPPFGSVTHRLRFEIRSSSPYLTFCSPNALITFQCRIPCTGHVQVRAPFLIVSRSLPITQHIFTLNQVCDICNSPTHEPHLHCTPTYYRSWAEVRACKSFYYTSASTKWLKTCLCFTSLCTRCSCGSALATTIRSFAINTFINFECTANAFDCCEVRTHLAAETPHYHESLALRHHCFPMVSSPRLLVVNLVCPGMQSMLSHNEL
jgi:hypothetical protein